MKTFEKVKKEMHNSGMLPTIIIILLIVLFVAGIVLAASSTIVWVGYAIYSFMQGAAFWSTVFYCVSVWAFQLFLGAVLYILSALVLSRS